MEQSRIESLIESFLNVGSGFIFALIFWIMVITPVFNIQVSMADNIQITILFTFISIIRGFLWRRFFANDIHRKVTKFVRGYFK